MKIAIFSDTFPPQVNGVANVAHKSAVELAKLGHEVFVFTISTKLKKESHTISSHDHSYQIIRIPALPAFAYKEHRFALPIGIAFAKIKKIKPDVIHTHTPFSIGWEAILAASFFNIPVVGTHHTFYDYYLRHVRLDFKWAKKFSWKYTVGYYNRCDLILSPTRSLADSLIDNGLKRPVIILPNPIDTDLFTPVKNQSAKKILKQSLGLEDFSLTYMGRVSYEKSIDKLIDAVCILKKTNPRTQLVIVGDGPEKKNLEHQVRNLGLSNNVIFAGFKHGEELVRYLQASDVFLSASKSENMPLSILEAMATGLPVIGVDSLGVPEIVGNELNGFIIKPDHPEKFAEKIKILEKNPELLKKYSAESRKMSMSFSQNSIAKSLSDIYEKLTK